VPADMVFAPLYPSSENEQGERIMESLAQRVGLSQRGDSPRVSMEDSGSSSNPEQESLKDVEATLGVEVLDTEAKQTVDPNVKVDGFTDDVLDKLMLVSVTPVIPKNGIMQAAVYDPKTGNATAIFRPVQYFALSTVVPDEFLGSLGDMASGKKGSVVDSRKYVVLIPYRNLQDRILNIWPFDTIVFGDYALANVSAIIVHPEDDKPEVEPSVFDRVQFHAYGEEGKRKSIEDLLKHRRFASLASYRRMGKVRASARYVLPGGRVVELGSASGYNGSAAIGEANAEFIRKRYDGQVSFGPELAPVLTNGMTETLLPNVILTSLCHNLKQLTSMLPLWWGWASIGDDLFQPIWTGRFGNISYKHKMAQKELWSNCKLAMTSEVYLNQTFLPGVNLQVAGVVLPNMAWKLARGDMPSLYTRSPAAREPVAEMAQAFSVEMFNECPPGALRLPQKMCSQSPGKASPGWVRMFDAVFGMMMGTAKYDRPMSGAPEPTATCPSAPWCSSTQAPQQSNAGRASMMGLLTIMVP